MCILLETFWVNLLNILYNQKMTITYVLESDARLNKRKWDVMWLESDVCI